MMPVFSRLALLMGAAIALPSLFAPPVFAQAINDGRYWVDNSDFTIIVTNGRLVSCIGGASQGGANRCGNMKVRVSSTPCTVWLIVDNHKKVLMRQNQSACGGV